MTKTVLIVDDSLSIRQLVRAALTSVGYSVIDAIDGQDALNKLVGQRVNLIISDVNMPNMDGITCNFSLSCGDGLLLPLDDQFS